MAAAPPIPRLDRNVRLYPWYALSFNAYFWMPVYVLYFLQHMPLATVLRLEAIYYLGVVILEVPSGYFSDRFGRRPTLLLAALFLLFAYVLFFLGDSFGVFAIAQVLLAAGLAFNSGTDTSLHYDSLASMGREAEYDQREAVASRNMLLASGLAGLLGGAVAMAGLRYAYLLSAAAALASLGIAIAMREPVSQDKRQLPPNPAKQFALCLSLLKDRTLAWTFAFVITMTVLNHVPYEFYQPYIRLALDRIDSMGNNTPITAGLHMGLVMIIASFFAARSIKFRDRVGYSTAMLSTTALQLLIIVAMGLFLHPLILLLVLLRSVPRALMSAPVNAVVAPRVAADQRATFLSLQSLAGRLAFSGFLIAISFANAVEGTTTSWTALSTGLKISAVVGIVGIVLLWLKRPRPTRSKKTIR